MITKSRKMHTSTHIIRAPIVSFRELFEKWMNVCASVCVCVRVFVCCQNIQSHVHERARVYAQTAFNRNCIKCIVTNEKSVEITKRAPTQKIKARRKSMEWSKMFERILNSSAFFSTDGKTFVWAFTIFAVVDVGHFITIICWIVIMKFQWIAIEEYDIAYTLISRITLNAISCNFNFSNAGWSTDDGSGTIQKSARTHTTTADAIQR